MKRLKTNLICLLVAALLAAGIGYIRSRSPAQPTKASKPTSQTTPIGFNKHQYSVDQPGSPWWIVNKTRPLPAGYAPNDLAVPSVPLRLAASAEQMHLSQTLIPATQDLFTAAKAAGFNLMLASGYRSAAYQSQLFNSYVATDGQAAADRSSARPNTSEHQTGMAMDVCLVGTSCDLVQSFGDTPAGQWVANNAHNYGFIVRYLKGKDASTGYEYEPWHIRYVGKSLATELHKTGQTMEEFFGVGSGAQ